MTGQQEGYLITEEEWEKCLNHIELLRNVDIPWKETKTLLDGITRTIRSRQVKSEQAIRKDATGKVLEQLDDLRKYANGEYQEAECSDNEREMRIHLEYENRIWGIMKELRKGGLE